MDDRTTVAAREESGALGDDNTIGSLEWDHDQSGDDRYALNGITLRRPSIASRVLGLLNMGGFRRRIKDAHTMPLMYGTSGRSPTGSFSLENRVEKSVYGKSKFWKSRVWASTGKSLLTMVVVALAVLGLLHLTESMLGGTSLLFGLSQRRDHPTNWREFDYIRDVVKNRPSDITRDVIPLPCHSHNDYWRRIPLYEALHYGCASVEADIWLTDDSEDPELYVGHSHSSLTKTRTLRNLYVNPLLDLLNAMNSDNTTTTTESPLNGVFQTSPTHPLVLLIDIKNNPHATFTALQTHLQPFRAKNYLTTHNGTALTPGPLTIVTTGSTPYASILAQNASNRDIFFDAPLGDLPPSKSSNPQDHETYKDYNTITSLYASASLPRTLGSFFPFSLFPSQPSASQLARVRSAVAAAHARGLQVRWWETPAWPRGRRERVWRILMEEGADVLNVDDLKAVRGWRGW